jgi:hypothetical protein
VPTITLPQLGHPWPDLPGSTFAGITTSPDGQHHALVLLADKPDARLPWKDAMAWAEALGASLPTKAEAALLFDNIGSQFESGWHWTGTQYAGDESYAWYQNFGDGYQFINHKSYEARARAVRRFPLDPSILQVAS